MVRILIALLAAIATASLYAAPPNVIVIMSDDRGSTDLGCYGANDLHMSHTDSLATRGVRFTQFYSAALVCSPSRAGLLTGRWPVRAGAPSNGASQKGAKSALPSEEITMANAILHRTNERYVRRVNDDALCLQRCDEFEL